MSRKLPKEHKDRKAQDKKKKPRKRPGGKVIFPDDMPRKDVRHELSEAEKAGRSFMRDEVVEELDIEVNLIVIRHIYPVYGEKKDAADNEKAVVSPERPQKILRGCQYSDNFIAHILAAKYQNGMPFYRQEQLFKSHNNLTVNRSRMCYWATKIGWS